MQSDTRQWRNIFVAATMPGVRELEELLRVDGVRLAAASTFEDALARLAETRHPDLIVIGYHFDELRPFRLVHKIRSNSRMARVPIVLVQLFPFRTAGSNESAIREAYRGLGVQEFFALPHEIEEHGRASALRRIRAQVLRLLRLGDDRRRTA